MNPAMLLVNVTNPIQVVQIVISALIGLFGVAAALNGYLYRTIPMVLRLALIVGGLGMMIPGMLTDLVGFLVVGGIIVFQKMSAKRLVAAEL